jgi:hypothetical protein
MQQSEASIAARFTTNDPRRINKPVGARMTQVTQFRKFLEKKRAITEDGEEIDRKTWLLKVQYDKAQNEGDTAAAKFCLDYAAFKPVEKLEIESQEVTEFSSEQEELLTLKLEIESIDRQIAEIELERKAIEKGDSMVESAEKILSE